MGVKYISSLADISPLRALTQASFARSISMSLFLKGGAAIIPKPLKLLRGGTVLVHGDQDRVLPQSADVLIEGDRISKIEAAIPAPAGCHIIDCTDKIISPGFVDTHHHVWQSPLKGFFGDTALFPYLAIGSFTQ